MIDWYINWIWNLRSRHRLLGSLLVALSVVGGFSIIFAVVMTAIQSVSWLGLVFGPFGALAGFAITIITVLTLVIWTTP